MSPTALFIFYWIAGLMLLSNLLKDGLFSGSYLRAAAWILGMGVVAAVSTVVHLVKQAPRERLGEQDGDDAGAPASALGRLAWAIWFSMAAAAFLAGAALVPDLRLQMLGLAIGAIVIAAYKLFFGRRSGSTDMD